MSTLVELCRDEAHCSCAWGNVVIFYSAAEPDPLYCARNASAVIAYAKKYPSGLGMLVLIAQDEPPPSPEARQTILHSYVTMQDHIAAGVLVVEGEGFAASVKRSVIALINLRAKLKFPLRVAGNIPEGSALIVKMLGERLAAGVDARSIAEAAAAVRVRLSD